MLIGLLNKVQLVIQDGLTKDYSYLISKQIFRMGRKSGWLFCALYLKQCSLSLMLGNPSDPVRFVQSVPVSLTRSGLPRIIPSFHRRVIKSGSSRGDMLIHIYVYIHYIKMN